MIIAFKLLGDDARAFFPSEFVYIAGRDDRDRFLAPDDIDLLRLSGADPQEQQIFRIDDVVKRPLLGIRV